MIEHDSNEVVENADIDAPVSKKTSQWRKIWVALLLVPAIVFSAAVFMAQSEQGTIALCNIVNTLTAGKVKVDWRSGSLLHGGAASTVNIHLRNTHVDISNIYGEWQWDYLPLKWQVMNLSADEVNLTLIPKVDTGEPMGDIVMPFAIDAKRVQVNTFNLIRASSALAVAGNSVTTISNIDGAVNTDKRHHAISLTQLTQGTAEFNGQVNVDGVRPYAIDGQVRAISNFEDHEYQLGLTAKGDFKHLNIGIQSSGGVSESPLNGSGNLEVQLLERYYIHKGQVDIRHLNPYVFWNKLLKADLDISLNATPQDLEVSEDMPRKPVNGHWTVINHAPGPLSNLELPVHQASGSFALTAQQQDLNDIEFLLPNSAHISGSGSWRDTKGVFKFDVVGFDLKTIHPKLLSTSLDGELNIDASKNIQHFVATLKNSGNNYLDIFADVSVDKERVNITKARVASVAETNIEVQGELLYTEGLPFKGKAKLLQFNLASLGDFPSSRLVGQFDIDGLSQPKAKVNIRGNLNDSTWAGVPAKGVMDVSFDAADKVTARILDVTIGANHIDAKGALGISAPSLDKLNLNINAPNLSQLQFGFAGNLIAKAELTGSLSKPRGKVDATASDLKFANQSVQSAKINGVWESGTQGSINGTINIKNYLSGPIKLDDLKLEVSGTQAAHQFNTNVVGNIIIREAASTKAINGATVLKTPAVQWILNAQAQGQGQMTDNGWQGQISQLVNRGQPNIKTQRPIQVAWDKGELKLGNIVAQVQDAQVNIDMLNILGSRINSRGRVSNLVMPQWLSWLNIALPSNIVTDMTIKGQWDLIMGSAPSGGFSLERERGDVWMDKRQKNAIGLSALNLKGVLSGRTMNITGLLQSDRLGRVDIGGQLGLVNSDTGWVISGLSPLDVSAKAEFKKLDQFNALLGANIKLQGQMQADMKIGGALSKPNMSGVLTGQNLDFLHVEQGFRLKDGVVRLKLSDTAVDFEQFDFSGVEGKLSVRGQASYGAGKLLTAQVSMDKLRPFVRLDRQLVVSGQADLSYDGERKLNVTGKIRADKAMIDLPPTLPPSLGDDVIVCSSEPLKSRRCNGSDGTHSVKVQPLGLIPSIDLTLDLGDNFRFKGQGADVKLVGNVRLQSEEGSALRAKGVVRVDDGSYKFYGQNLRVERGLITFQGPIDDPALNMFATRNIDTIEVGVELTGTLADSKARLISTPEMPDEEKLSWLLFGRSSSNLSNTDGSAIAGAAAILLGSDQGRKITEKLGIDSFNFGSSDNGLTGTVVGVGKRLNDKFSVAYEQTIEKVAGVVKVTWNLSRNWQLILRGGSINGADIQYSRRFDKLH